MHVERPIILELPEIRISLKISRYEIGYQLKLHTEHINIPTLICWRP